MSGADTPELEDLIMLGIDKALGRVHTKIPGHIVAYDATTQKATVQIAIRSRYVDPDGNSLFYLPQPIANLPVLWPSGGGMSLTFPLTPGDPCLLLVCERSIDEWKATGEADNEPLHTRRLDLTDAMVFPGGRPFNNPLPASAIDPAAMVLAGDLKLGSSAAVAFVANATLTDTQLQQLAAVFTAWVVVANDGGAALKTALTALISGGWPQSVATTKVKAL